MQVADFMPKNLDYPVGNATLPIYFQGLVVASPGGQAHRQILDYPSINGDFDHSNTYTLARAQGNKVFHKVQGGKFFI